MKLADAFPDDLWGRKARRFARVERAAEVAIEKQRQALQNAPSYHRGKGIAWPAASAVPQPMVREPVRTLGTHEKTSRVAVWRCQCGYVVNAKHSQCAECKRLRSEVAA